MKESEQGMVIPFGMSGSRLRRSAQEYRRRGQVLEALSLMRRAAEQEDTAWGWQALAAEFRQLGCWEAAAVLLGRTLSREEHAPSAWLDMARCQAALGNSSLAADCLYHQLQESPWSPEGDAARAMLPQLETTEEIREPHRTRQLIQRGMQAWHRGDRRLGLRRLKRAVRLSEQKARLMTTVALLHMLQGELRTALRWLTRALRGAPTDAHALCSMAAVLQQTGKQRMARAFLRLAAARCREPQLEERFFTTAWAMDAWSELDAFLEERLQRQPFRLPLLGMRAAMLCEQHKLHQAQLVWRQMLSIDPGDRWAATMQAWKKQYPYNAMPPPGCLPLPILVQQRAAVLNRSSAADLFRFGSEERRVLDWCAASTDADEQGILMGLLAEQPDRETEKRCLRELLTRPDVQETLRQRALMRLAELRCFEPLTVLVGDRYTTAQCQPSASRQDQSLWRLFLPLLLRETARYGRSREIVEFAAAMWRMMPKAERIAAVTSDAYCWCKIMEVLWLMQEARAAEAQAVLEDIPPQSRSIRRKLQRFLKTIEKKPGDAGEGDTSL